MAQRVGGGARRGADAADEAFASSGDAQHLSLLFDDGADETGRAVIALHTWLELQGLQRNVDDAHLIRHQAEDVCKLCAISRR